MLKNLGLDLKTHAKDSAKLKLKLKYIYLANKITVETQSCLGGIDDLGKVGGSISTRK